MDMDRWMFMILTIGLTCLVYRDCYTVNAILLSNLPTHKINSSLSEKKALDELLSKARYDNRSAPPSDEPVLIDVGIMLITLASPDESSLRYEIEFLLNMSWTDNRLRYEIVNDDTTDEEYQNKSIEWKYNRELERIRPSLHNLVALPLKLEQYRKPFLDGLCHSEEVWTPDVYFIKHGDFRQHIDPKHLELKIYPSGRIYLATRKYLILHCSGNPKVFPFDVANCSFSLESVSHEIDQLLFRWDEENIELKESTTLRKLNAYLKSTKTWYCTSQSVHDRGTYSCLQLELIFTRDQAFYFTTLFIPGIILVTSSFITFWLEWNAVAARIMLGVTTMLNFFITSNRFRATLPVVSELHAMNTWEAFSMVFIYTALLEFICVNYVGRKRPRVPVPAKVEEDMSSGIEDRTEENNIDNPESQKNRPVARTGKRTLTSFIQAVEQRLFENPIKTAKKIDVISRIIFPLAYFIVLIFFFAKYLVTFEVIKSWFVAKNGTDTNG